jgi:hypothetical protein
MAEEKEELDKTEMSPEQLQEAMAKEAKEMEERYDELFNQLEEGGYFNQTYGADSKVEIPGPLFNSFIWFVNNQSKHINSVRSVLSVVDNTLSGLSTNINEMTMRLMEQHKGNVDAGATISMDDQMEEDAKEEIKVTAKPKNKKKKKATIKVATGSTEG